MLLSSKKKPGYWQGGEGFGLRDGAAGVLAVLSDAFNQRAGGQGGAVQMLAGGRSSALEALKQREERLAQVQRLRSAGVSDAQADLLAHGDIAKPSYGDLNPQPTTEMQNFKAFQGFDPATRQQYGEFKDLSNPIITNGYGSQYVPRTTFQGAAPAQAGPAVGTVEDGYQFVGGNPADPNSWRQVQSGPDYSIPSGNPLEPFRR
jgi:hypothetical protein